MKADPIVGHKTWADGTHTPLRKSEADALWAAADAAKEKRAADMPTEQDAIDVLTSAHQRLKELGWNDAIYCPKDGSEFDAIEAGSSGIHRALYTGEWPTGHWWVADAGDLWPSRPILYRVSEEEKQRWKQGAKAIRELAASVDTLPKGQDPQGLGAEQG